MIKHINKMLLWNKKQADPHNKFSLKQIILLTTAHEMNRLGYWLINTSNKLSAYAGK